MLPDEIPRSQKEPVLLDAGARGELVDLLESLFSPNEFRRFVASFSDGEEILLHLPSEALSPATYFSEAAGVLLRRGIVQEAFFAQLLAEMPRRGGEIRRVRQFFTSSEGPDAERSVAPVECVQPPGSAPGRSIRWLAAEALALLALGLSAWIVGPELGVTKAPRPANEVGALVDAPVPGGAAESVVDESARGVAPPPQVPKQTPKTDAGPTKKLPMPRTQAAKEPEEAATQPAEDPAQAVPLDRALAEAVRDCPWFVAHAVVRVTLGAGPVASLSPELSEFPDETTRCIHRALADAWPRIDAAMQASRLRSASVRFTSGTHPTIFEARSEEE
ncbi:hypothetical protein [Nannocystis pusilla]|uniref:hypothetical protein n=1 Tax=Nannocystis pusilla TaxID=889268 RepID=UPI003DA358C5